jgi:hypothetical protein
MRPSELLLQIGRIYQQPGRISMVIRPTIAAAAVLPLLVLATACAVVREEEDGKTTRVAISTPVGGLAARTGENTGDTGLAVYPGAQLSRDDGDGDFERANVAIGTPWFGLRVIAAEYESGEPPERILAFYRGQLTSFGDVTECRGDVNFNNGQPECRSQPGSDDVQLMAGTEQRHRIVSVKPRGHGTEFALVSLQMGSTK